VIPLFAALSAVGFAAAPSGPASVLSAPNTSRPLPFVLILPFGRLSTLGSSELIGLLSRSLAEHTDLQLQPMDELQSGCAGLMSCMITRLRAAPGAPDLLLSFQSAAAEERVDPVSVELIDLEKAARAIAAAKNGPPRSKEDLEIDLELAVSKSAIAASRKITLKTKEEAEAFAGGLVEHDLEAALSERGHWHPFGRIEVALEAPGFELQLDADALGVAPEGLVAVTGVPAGRRTLRLRHPDADEAVLEVEVSAGATSSLVAPAVRWRPSSGRVATLWTGLGVAAAGVGLGAYALSTHGPTSTCLVGAGVPPSAPTGACPASPAFRSWGPILQVPLAYALLGAGGIAAAAAEWLGAPQDTPWIGIAAGGAVGALAYALSAGLNGKPVAP
jgi:hypothetical protein